MLGVVLWSDEAKGKAVIWCEDQGKLAYLTGEQAELCTDMELSAGDLVSFSLRMSSKLRFAENLSLVEEKGYQDLPGTLKGAAAAKPSKKSEPVLDQGAEIIQFRAKEQQPQSEPPLAVQVGA